MNDDRTIVNHLRAAADLLRPKGGWVKGRMIVRGRDNVRVCAVGAIYQVTSSTPMRNRLTRLLYGQLPRQLQEDYRLQEARRLQGDPRTPPLVVMRSAVMSFNDRRRTVKADVLALFESVAEAFELRGEIAKLPKKQLLKAPSLGLDVPVEVKR